jgi:hypothetical protein
MKNEKLQSTKERLWKKCSDWNEKYMSSSAKETLVKSVAPAITMHSMSVFKFLAGLYDDLSQIIRDFWRGMKKIEKECIGWLGTRSPSRSVRAVWGSGTFASLIRLFSLNRHGVSSSFRKACARES